MYLLPERAESLEDIGTMRMCSNTEQYAGVARNGQIVYARTWELLHFSLKNYTRAYDPNLWYWLDYGRLPETAIPTRTYPGTEDW